MAEVQILKQVRRRRAEGLYIGTTEGVGGANLLEGTRNRVPNRQAQAGLALVVVLHKRLLSGIEILILSRQSRHGQRVFICFVIGLLVKELESHAKRMIFDIGNRHAEGEVTLQ